MLYFFFFKQKTAYEMRISDWSSDVCSSDLWRAWRRPLGFLLLSVLLCTALVSGLKWLSHMDCPWDLARYGGTRAYHGRSEERRVGKECVSTCRSWWSPVP